MATTNTWDQVVSKITGVANRGAFSKTYTPSTSRQTQNGSAGYYSSITTVCNAVSLSGNASTSQVLTGRTFYTTSLTKQTGTMANRGALNWSPSGSTSYSVPAGYYSGGTLNSANAYNAGKTAAAISATQVSFQTFSSTYGTSQTKSASNLQNAYHLLIGVINSGTASISFSGGTQVFDLDRMVSGNGYAYTRVRLVKTSSGASVSCTATSSYQIYGGYFACYRLSLG